MGQPRLINGNAYAFSSIEARFAGVPFNITRIDYEFSNEPGEARGNHSQIEGFSAGEFSIEGTFEMNKHVFDKFRDHLGDGLMQTEFSIPVSYADVGQPTTTDNVNRVRITKIKNSGQKGTDPLVVECSFKARSGLLGGVAPIRNMQI